MKRSLGEELKKRKVPGVLIPGLLAAMAMGWAANEIYNKQNFYEIEAVFPKTAMIGGTIDGDNIYLENGQSIRLIGINAPERGEENFEKAKTKLDSLTANKKVYLEYDREDDGQYGRLLAWVWVDCESTPDFLPYDYMRVGYHRSRSGLKENPDGCKEGKLINELMVDSGLAKVETYKDRGELKYEARLKE
ncbi:MAG: hypothetical protein UV54_C0015G0001 [Candidatus Beckwithbacteria bacterium GW2011_GWA2_43_10]|uniref:TNase-like domain-containing protein n=1 Tax=Candidatus Beckwithbacteria bacterium GW2011_GWA2_43_10 TaxID=1618369 RepID=A0A0G1EZX3_9BACT|nr:MAG: hypothetical protein UV54_C0015G0001 [Candidatus Beckwithbacteria bacterium GW2011_GWA2_43_10]